MMKTVIYYFIILLFIMPLALTSQTSGYMGKRFNVGYGFYFSPALINPNAKGNTILGRAGGSSNDLMPAFNSQHEIFAEFVLSTRFVLGASAKFYKTAYDNKKPTGAQVQYVDQYGYSNSTYYFGSPTDFYYIKGINYALYAKMFNRRYLAPWGRYTIFGITVKNYTCSYNPDKMYLKSDNSYYGNMPKYSDFGSEKQSFTKFDFIFGFGRTRIVANRIIFDYGFNTHFAAFMTSFFDMIDMNNDGAFFDRNPDPGNYMAKTSPWRLRGFNRFNVFLKIGILL